MGQQAERRSSSSSFARRSREFAVAEARALTWRSRTRGCCPSCARRQRRVARPRAMTRPCPLAPPRASSLTRRPSTPLAARTGCASRSIGSTRGSKRRSHAASRAAASRRGSRATFRAAAARRRRTRRRPSFTALGPRALTRTPPGAPQTSRSGTTSAPPVFERQRRPQCRRLCHRLRPMPSACASAGATPRSRRRRRRRPRRRPPQPPAAASASGGSSGPSRRRRSHRPHRRVRRATAKASPCGRSCRSVPRRRALTNGRSSQGCRVA